MKRRLISVLAFALAVSAGAAFVLYQLISSKVNSNPTAAQPTTKVFVAARDLELGALITEKEIRVQDYLTPPSGAITKKEDLIGRGVANPIHQDAPFFEAALAQKGAGAGFAATIPIGMRAFAVHVNEVVGVAGFVVAGAKVDILVSGAQPGASESLGAVTKTMLQNITVLSAGQNFQKDAEGKPVLVQVVNLLVTPEQAEKLNIATENRIQLVLRNPTDNQIVTTPGASAGSIFTGAAIPQPKPVAPIGEPVAAKPFRPADQVAPILPLAPEPSRNVTIEVISGDHRSESTFRNPDAPRSRANETPRPESRLLYPPAQTLASPQERLP